MAEPTSHICETCGAAFTHPAGPGRPPKHCVEHRRPRGVVRDVDGARERKNALRARKRAAGAKAPGERLPAAPTSSAWDEPTLLRYAVLIPLCRTPERIARWMSLKLTAEKLAELDAEARALYPDLAAGRVEATAALMTTGMGIMTVESMVTAGQMAPRDIVGGVQRLAAARGLLVGDERPQEYASIEIVVRGADGRAIPLGAKKGAA